MTLTGYYLPVNNYLPVCSLKINFHHHDWISDNTYLFEFLVDKHAAGASILLCKVSEPPKWQEDAKSLGPWKVPKASTRMNKCTKVVR